MNEPITLPPPFDKKVTPIDRAHLYRILKSIEQAREEIHRLTGWPPPKGAHNS